MQFKVVQKTEETNIDMMQETELRQELASWKNKYDETKQKYEETLNTIASYKEETSAESKTRETLEKELQTLEEALGRTDVEGEGIIITLAQKKDEELGEDEEMKPIIAEDLIYIINYLKDAGAEAISINGERVVNTSAISCDGNIIIVNGKKVSTPIEIAAIGYAPRLTTLSRAGGTLENFALDGKGVEIKKPNNIEMPKFTGVYNFKYLKTK